MAKTLSWLGRNDYPAIRQVLVVRAVNNNNYPHLFNLQETITTFTLTLLDKKLNKIPVIKS